MRGVDGDRRQQQIDFSLVEIESVRTRAVRKFAPLQDANLLLAQRGQQLLVQARILRVDKVVQHYAQPVEPLLGCQTGLIVPLRLVESILDTLQQAGYTDLDELIQIVGRNREKLHPLQQRIARVARLFKDSLIEEHPGLVAVEEQVLARWRRFLRSFFRGALPCTGRLGGRWFRLN